MTGSAPGSGGNDTFQEEVTAASHDDPKAKGTAMLTLESRAFFILAREVTRQDMNVQASLGTHLTESLLSLKEAREWSERDETQ